MQEITTLAQWQALKEASHQHPVVLLKHSNACGTSAGRFQVLEQAEKDGVLEQPIHVVVVQTERDISNAIAKDTGITHESPQVIILKNEAVTYSASHHAIDPAHIAQELTS